MTRERVKEGKRHQSDEKNWRISTAHHREGVVGRTGSDFQQCLRAELWPREGVQTGRRGKPEKDLPSRFFEGAPPPSAGRGQPHKGESGQSLQNRDPSVAAQGTFLGHWSSALSTSALP